jgi:hypothetical protein
MTDRITLYVYRTHAENAPQVQLVRTDENGSGLGYRLAGPKHYNMGVTELLANELDAQDAAETRAMLDAAFPNPVQDELTTLRRIVAEHIWAAATTNPPTDDDALTRIVAVSEAATALQVTLDNAGIDLTDELDRLAAANFPAELGGPRPTSDDDREPCGESGCICYGTGPDHADCACGCDCPRDEDGQRIYEG